jgi:hypothetical protein
MNREELEKYKIRDYYMIPVEVVDNMFYLFEQQCKKQKEAIYKTIMYLEKFVPIEEDTIIMRERQRDYLLDILKEVSE